MGNGDGKGHTGKSDSGTAVGNKDGTLMACTGLLQLMWDMMEKD